MLPAEVQAVHGGSPRSIPRKVVGHWLVSSSVPKIEVSRTLRVRVHRVPTVRVEIPNPYKVAKTFKLHTDRPELLRVQQASTSNGSPIEHMDATVVSNLRARHEVTVGARSKYSVQWTVRVDTAHALASPGSFPGGGDNLDAGATIERSERALLFVTDEADKIEETIELWLDISPLPTSLSW